eukprot:1156924-Pelagomonas_calceolata.AAC.14
MCIADGGWHCAHHASQERHPVDRLAFLIAHCRSDILLIGWIAADEALDDQQNLDNAFLTVDEVAVMACCEGFVTHCEGVLRPVRMMGCRVQ